MGLALSAPACACSVPRLRLIRRSSGGCRAVCRCQRSFRQSDDHRQGGPRAQTLLRQAVLGQRHLRVRQLPSAGARLHRRSGPAIGSTGQSHAQLDVADQRRLQLFVWLGRSGLRTLEAQMSVPMFNEHPIELGLPGTKRRSCAGSRHAATRRGSLRRSRATRSPCHWRMSSGPSRRSSGRCSRLILRSIDISTETIGPRSHSRRFAA